MRAVPDRGEAWLPQAALALVVVAIAAHAVAYAWHVADPVVVSDAWHFIDLVIRPHATGEFGIGDLFVKRNALDHSQPLSKLVSIANYEWFDLDFRFEALFGALFACASIAILWAAWRRAREPGGTSPAESLAMASIAAVYLSIGTSTAYSWPLVTMGFTTHVFLLGLAWAAWRALVAPRPRTWGWLCATTVLVGVVADDVGLVAGLAIVLASLVVAWREQRWRAATAVVAILALSLGAYLLSYRLLFAPVGGAAPPSMVTGLVALASRPDQWWDLVAPPLVAAVVHRAKLAEWLGADAVAAATHAIAVVLVACHAWFWLAALRRRARMNLPAFLAMVLMLLFYGLLAALWLTRIAQFGADYLWQPRYVVLYRWHLLALLLMLLAQVLPVRGAARAATPPAARAMLAVAALLLVLQVPLAVGAWKEAPYIARYQLREARQVIEMAANGGQPPQACIPTLVVCRFQESQRRRVLHFLQSQRLNVFDPELREDLGIEPAR